MRAERIILRAKHLASRKALEGMLQKAIRENSELIRLVAELRQALQKHEDDVKLIRPATMGETAKIMVTK